MLQSMLQTHMCFRSSMLHHLCVTVEMPTEMVVSKFKRDTAMPRVVDELKVELTRKHAREASVKVSNGEFVVEAASRYLGWAESNQHKKVPG